jgi:GDP-D-mannose dehydratase
VNLVIGDTSQQSYYYPNDYKRISSRNIDLDYLRNNKFDSVYITFAEQRIYDSGVDYITPNYLYTVEIINSLIDNCNRIISFTSCELWSNSVGTISVDDKFDFDPNNGYTVSKMLLVDEIKRLRKIDDKYNKVKLLHPFYFNSVYRSKYFLFGKIFDSIINKKMIEVGNLDFYRDMVHAKFLVKKALEADTDMMLGSGKLFNVRDFVIDLYNSFNMDYFQYVKEDKTQKSNSKFLRADVDWNYTYNDLLNETIEDIKNFKSNL